MLFCAVKTRTPVREVCGPEVGGPAHHDVASSQQDALKRLKVNEYSYVLSAIKIRARAGSGLARIQNTENLLEKMSELKDGAAPPVVLMSDYAVNSVEHTVDVMRLAMSLGDKGAVDIIAKPFPTAGRTLDRVIKKVLGIPVNGLAKRNRRATADDGPAPDRSDDGDGWLSVTQAARLLMHDLPALDLSKARSRISTAASRDEFRVTSSRKSRRIDPHSFAFWRLKQRDNDLDEEDDDEA